MTEKTARYLQEVPITLLCEAHAILETEGSSAFFVFCRKHGISDEDMDRIVDRYERFHEASSQLRRGVAQRKKMTRMTQMELAEKRRTA